MRLVLQRVQRASITINGEIVARIGRGLMVLVGIEHEDTEEEVQWLVKKTVDMRIFDDAEGVMNLSIKDIDGDVLVVSQFTLHASTRKGNRPSYIRAARPEVAEKIYERYKSLVSIEMKKEVQSGVFGADMKCELVNDGPVTIIVDSKYRE